jgi:hypothetical protein
MVLHCLSQGWRECEECEFHKALNRWQGPVLIPWGRESHFQFLSCRLFVNPLLRKHNLYYTDHNFHFSQVLLLVELCTFLLKRSRDKGDKAPSEDSKGEA